MNKLLALLKEQNYQEAEIYIRNWDKEKLEEKLVEIAFESESLSVYAFVCHLLRVSETSALHEIAALLMCQPLCFFDGAYYISAFHLKRAIDLSPLDTSLMELVLFLYQTPDRPIEHEKAFKTAKRILELEPENRTAKEFLNFYFRHETT